MQWADQVAPMAYYRIALRTADEFRRRGITAYLVKSTVLDKELLDMLNKEFVGLYNTPLPDSFRK
jgi:hypothetical protein